MTDTKDKIAEIRARLGAATPGPWLCASVGGRCSMNHQHGQGECDYRTVIYDGSSTEVWAGLIEEGARHPDELDDQIIAGQWDYDQGGIRKTHDAEFIAHAPTDIRYLLDEVDRLRTDGLRVTGITHRGKVP